MSSFQSDIFADIVDMQNRIRHVPYCCQHVMAIEHLEHGSYALHGLARGRHLMLKVDGQDIFRGMPSCKECAQAHSRFTVGANGNLIQKWTSKALKCEELHMLMQFSSGRFIVRAMPAVTFTYGDYGLLTPTFVWHCEKQFWRMQVETTINDTRPLVIGQAPYHGMIQASEDKIRTDMHEVQLFIRAFVSGVEIRLLPDEDDKQGYVGLSWGSQSCRNEHTFTGILWVKEDRTPMEYFRLVAAAPNPMAYLVTQRGTDWKYLPTGWFAFTPWRDIYRYIEAETGAGLLPFSYNRQGSLDTPYFFVQMAEGK